jgi:hypothetical protein
MFPHPVCTKETRVSNNSRMNRELNINQSNLYNEAFPTFSGTPDQFLRTQSSSIHQPIPFQHDHYMIDRFSNINQQNGTNRMDFRQVSTRDIGKSRNDEPVQKGFQMDYFMTNYETLNKMNPQNHYMDGQFGNRNPTNINRDNMEKQRLQDRKQFMNHQGGNLNNFVDITPQNTRKERNDINTSAYVPMARTLALPKDKI